MHRLGRQRLQCSAAGLLLAVTFVAVPLVARAETPTVAGLTLKECVALLDDEDRTVRCRAVRTLGGFEQDAAQPLTAALDHSDAAVRYLAAVQLGRIGGAGLQASTEELEKLAGDERSNAVQMAAAFAPCRVGKLDEHLDLLIERLKSNEHAMACSAAALIGDIGPSAARAVPALEQARDGQQGNGKSVYPVGRAAAAALRKVQPE